MSTYITYSTAARLLHVSRQRIAELVQLGKLRKHAADGKPALDLEEVCLYAETRKVGRPRKERKGGDELSSLFWL